MVVDQLFWEFCETAYVTVTAKSRKSSEGTDVYMCKTINIEM